MDNKKTIHLSIAIPAELYTKLKIFVAINDKTMKGCIIEAIETSLKGMDKILGGMLRNTE
jgi:hypothetical protein